MCGIHCMVCSLIIDKSRNLNVDEDVKMMLQNRGPDQNNAVEIERNDCSLLFYGCVLHMRGSSLALQPSISKCGNILLFNGEVFSGLEVPENISDTSVLLDLLNKCSSIDEIKSTLTLIEGPWSIVYFQREENRLFFGRDYFGRRSLLISTFDNQLVISSATKIPRSTTVSWTEVPTGLHYVDINDSFKNEIKSISWSSVINKKPKMDPVSLDFSNFKENCVMSSPIVNYQNPSSQSEVEEPLQIINDDLLSMLVGVCDHKTLWFSCRELLKILEKSIFRRTRILSSWKKGAKVGVLFSGGVDCTVLVCLVHKVLPINEPVDLLSVAFEQIGKEKYNVPDRITGINSYKELLTLCPNRKFNFVEINVTVEELKRLRAERIAHLTYPKHTVLDDSIGCALWFASRGKGIVKNENNSGSVYCSVARILLCGMGADEQLGGYSRHRTVFQRTNDWNAVDNEIKMEIDRISSRNLGRDDRIISDHGKEARFPYLDEQVVGFLSSLSTHMKTDFRYPRGVGEKILLRGAAYLLGLREASVLPKRAIQFGSRIAKIEAAREKGSDACARLSACMAK